MKRKAIDQIDKATLEKYNYDIPEEILSKGMKENGNVLKENFEQQNCVPERKLARKITGIKSFSCQKEIQEKKRKFIIEQGAKNHYQSEQKPAKSFVKKLVAKKEEVKKDLKQMIIGQGNDQALDTKEEEKDDHYQIANPQENSEKKDEIKKDNEKQTLHDDKNVELLKSPEKKEDKLDIDAKLLFKSAAKILKEQTLQQNVTKIEDNTNQLLQQANEEEKEEVQPTLMSLQQNVQVIEKKEELQNNLPLSTNNEIQNSQKDTVKEVNPEKLNKLEQKEQLPETNKGSQGLKQTKLDIKYESKEKSEQNQDNANDKGDLDNKSQLDLKQRMFNIFPRKQGQQEEITCDINKKVNQEDGKQFAGIKEAFSQNFDTNKVPVLQNQSFHEQKEDNNNNPFSAKKDSLKSGLKNEKPEPNNTLFDNSNSKEQKNNLFSSNIFACVNKNKNIFDQNSNSGKKLFSDLKNPDEKQKGSRLFSFLSENSNQKPQSVNLFSNSDIQANQFADNQVNQFLESAGPQLEKEGAPDNKITVPDFKYEEVYEKLFEAKIKIIKTNFLPKCNLGCVQIVKLKDSDQHLILYRSTTKTIMYQGRLLQNFEITYCNERKDAFSIPVFYNHKQESQNKNEEIEETYKIVIDQMMVKFLTSDDSIEFSSKLKECISL